MEGSVLLLSQKMGWGYPPYIKGINGFLEIKLMGGVTPPKLRKYLKRLWDPSGNSWGVYPP